MKLTDIEAAVTYYALLENKSRFHKQGKAAINRALNKLWIAHPKLQKAFQLIETGDMQWYGLK